MPLKHSIGILFSNLKLVWRLALFIVIIGLIAGAIIFSIVSPIIQDVIGFITGLTVDPDKFINHPFVTLREDIINKCLDFVKGSDLKVLIVTAVMSFWVIKFFMYLPMLPVTKVLHGKMKTGYDIGLVNAIVSTGFQNVLLSLILSVFTTITDLGLLSGCAALIYLCINNRSLIILIPVIIILYLCLHSLRLTLVSQWLPEICSQESKNIFNAFKSALAPTKKFFRKSFLCIFTLNFIVTSIVVTTALPTLFVTPVLALPIYIVLHSALCLTLNFTYHKDKYYLDSGTMIYTPEKLF